MEQKSQPDAQVETAEQNLDRQMTTDTVALEHSYHTSLRTWTLIFILGLAWGTCTLANVGPGTTSSYVAKTFGGTTSSSWIPNAGLFPLIGLQPLWGALSDRFGKKWFLVSGGVLGIAGNIIAGKASNINQVIGGQAINGVAASLLLLAIPTSMEVVPAKTRPYAQGFSAILNGLAAIVGLVESGGFAQMSTEGWRWVYYFNAIFFGLCAVLIAVAYRPPPTKLRRENSISNELKSVDAIGTITLLLGVVGVVTALTWGGNIYSWSSARVIAMLVVGVCFLVGFGFYESFGRKDGLIDHRFLSSRNFPVILAVAFVDGMLLYGINAFFPVEAEAIFTSNLLKVNLYLLPLNVTVLLGCFGSAILLGRFHHYRLMLVVSLVIAGLFLGLLALVTPSKVAMTCVFTGIIGICVGVTTVVPVVVMSYSVPSYLLGTAETLLASTRALGGVVGITIFATVYGNAMKANLPTGVAEAAIGAGLPKSSITAFLGALLSSIGSLTDVKGITPTIIDAALVAIKDISARSFRFVWIANMAIAVAAGLLCVLLKPVKDEMTDHVESALEIGQLRKKQMHDSQHD
ncbi:major facilitator superfamily domain-containing protein [Exophiala viscosa]|uniref:major facilitator superfamily domain-containing protein n=1 Tax=Exophiala viscosa TaxID=2486360 RepID=UPI00219FF841|nr:major facilitator superfamily domain-containing protein [Exophiala viscosa]